MIANMSPMGNLKSFSSTLVLLYFVTSVLGDGTISSKASKITPPQVKTNTTVFYRRCCPDNQVDFI